MEQFSVFFERRGRNPLRKKEIEDTIDGTNWDQYQKEKDILPPEEQAKLDKQVELQVPQDRIDNWKIAALKRQEQEARKGWLRDKVSSTEFEQIYEKYGVKFFIPKDEKILNTPGMFPLMRALKFSVDSFLTSIKDIVPNRKPRFVIKDLGKQQNPFIKDATNAGYHQDGIIYLDIDSVAKPQYFVHEYAHYLAGKVPKQAYPIINAAYKDMLDIYFRHVKKKRRNNLEGQDDEKLRRKVAAKFGLPSHYSATNPSEFFAEIITHWKNIPNNVATYKFKQAIKKVLSRL